MSIVLFWPSGCRIGWGVARGCFKNAFQLRKRAPQGLKPAFLKVLIGTAKAVPYPKPIYETRSKNNMGIIHFLRFIVAHATSLHKVLFVPFLRSSAFATRPASVPATTSAASGSAIIFLVSSVVSSPCGSGGTGRHTILRGWRRKAWGFKSPLPHHSFFLY